MKRRNLSGIYIFDTLEGERKPTCIEDCNEATRREWLRSLEPKARVVAANVLCDTIERVADYAHAEGMITSKGKELLYRDTDNRRGDGALYNLLPLCSLLRALGDRFGVTNMDCSFYEPKVKGGER